MDFFREYEIYWRIVQVGDSESENSIPVYRKSPREGSSGIRRGEFGVSLQAPFHNGLPIGADSCCIFLLRCPISYTKISRDFL